MTEIIQSPIEKLPVDPISIVPVINLDTIKALEPEVIAPKKYNVVWTPDLVEDEGDVNCNHVWVPGRDFPQPSSEGHPSPGRILPRICSLCSRKEFLFEHITEVEVVEEPAYLTLRKQVIARSEAKLQNTAVLE